MKRIIKLSLVLAFAAAVSLAMSGAPVFAQKSATKADSKMIYHNGPVLNYNINVYFIYYGCWNCGFPGSNFNTQLTVTDFISNLGSTPYFNINTTYPNAEGLRPTGAVIYGGADVDSSYSHGNELTATDIQELIYERIYSTATLPLDPNGVYIVLASSDVSANTTGFCSASVPPHHGFFTIYGLPVRYAFVGNASRCPSVAAPQFTTSSGGLLPTPNGSFAGDVMASTIAYALNELVTNPYGSGWYDRYGLENSDKCRNNFGSVYTTANGAKANMRLGGRDYLIQQNWVNDNRGRCALAYP